MDIEIEGIDELEKQMENLIKAVHPDKVEPVLLDAARTLAKVVKSKAPKVPTGNLRRGVKAKLTRRKSSKKGGLNAALGISMGEAAPAIAAMDYRIAPHAHLVEYGTVKASAHPFIRPSYDENKTKLENQIVDDISNLLDKGLA